MHSAFRNEVKSMDYRTKRENAAYSEFKDVSYTSIRLKEFSEAVIELRYALDDGIPKLEYAEALKFILDDNIQMTKSKTTIKALEAIIEAIEVRMSDLAK